MILIFTDKNDISTDKVLDWIIKCDRKFIRVNTEDTIDFFDSIDMSKGEKIIINYKKNKIDIDDISCVWYRRGYFLPDFNFMNSINLNNKIKKELNIFFRSEKSTIVHFFLKKLSTKKSIGSFDKYDINKLEQLSSALECGLKVPQTFITTNKADLIKLGIPLAHLKKCLSLG
ncbi:MAG: hypothetical protein WCK02_13425, partial [Bacteroidota bacterium]